MLGRLTEVFARLPIGDPLADGTLVGPLIDGRAYEAMVGALEQARADGGEVLIGGGAAPRPSIPTPTTSSPRSCGCRAQTELVTRGDVRPDPVRR